MGIYGVKSKTCNCKGSWSTLDANDNRIYMEHPCKEHRIAKGNLIWYNLHYILKHIIKNNNNIKVKGKYLCKILDIGTYNNTHTILKLEVIHNGYLNTDNFDEKKLIFYSQLNDEPMWKKIDGNVFTLTIIYQQPHHTVEEEWEPFDY